MKIINTMMMQNKQGCFPMTLLLCGTFTRGSGLSNASGAMMGVRITVRLSLLYRMDHYHNVISIKSSEKMAMKALFDSTSISIWHLTFVIWHGWLPQFGLAWATTVKSICPAKNSHGEDTEPIANPVVNRGQDQHPLGCSPHSRPLCPCAIDISQQLKPLE